MSVSQVMSRRGGRVIKRYRNRRLYDTKASCYVNHEGLLELAASEEKISVLDANSGADMTARVLAMALMDDASRGDQAPAPATVLRALAQLRGRERGALERHLAEATATFMARRSRGEASAGRRAKRR